jgi:hypothetical protein
LVGVRTFPEAGFCKAIGLSITLEADGMGCGGFEFD